MKESWGETYLILTLLHTRSSKREHLRYISEFLADRIPEDYEESELISLSQELMDLILFDAEAVVIRGQRLIDNMDRDDMKALGQFINEFLRHHPHPKHLSFKLLHYATSILKLHSRLHFPPKKFPHINWAFDDLECYERTLDKLHNFTSKIQEWFAEEEDMIPERVWVLTIQLYTLEFLSQYVPGNPKEVKSLLKKNIEKTLPLSAGHRCDEIEKELSELAEVSGSVHSKCLELIDTHLNRQDKTTLFSMAIELYGPFFHPKGIPFLEHFISTLELDEKDIGRIYFENDLDFSVLPEGFATIEVDSNLHQFVVHKNGLLPLVSKPSVSQQIIGFRSNDHETIEVCREDMGKSTSSLYQAGDELRFGDLSIIFNPAKNKICIYFYENRSLQIENLSVTFKGTSILKDVDLCAKPGEFIGICGMSGCGKTTLMMVLCGLMNKTKGSIHYTQDEVKTPSRLREISTYVSQDDILFKELTVRESLYYSASIREKGGSADMQRRSEDIMSCLGLEKYQNLRIGDETDKGISGGQRKRVNIGTAIVGGMKSILLFDEPCSGLDPTTSQEIIRLLRVISRRGHIVFVVTHDISNETINYFDKLLVLNQKGQTAFFGKTKSLWNFFSTDSPQAIYTKLNGQSSDYYPTLFKRSEYRKDLDLELQRDAKLSTANKSDDSKASRKKITRPGYFSNFFTFLKRDLLRKTRDRQYLIASLIQPILIAGIICMDFEGPLPNAIFSLVVSSLWIGAISGVREINSEWAQLKRDFHSGIHLSAYVKTKVLSSFLISGFQVLVLTGIVAHFEHFLEAPFGFSFFKLSLVLLTLNLFGVCLGLFLSTLFRSALASVGILPLILIPLLIKGGVLYRHEASTGVQWVTTTANPVRMAFEHALLCSDAILAPSLSKKTSRSLDEAEEQSTLWFKYQQKLNLYNKNPKQYQLLFSESSEDDNILDNILNNLGRTDLELLRPAEPVGVNEPELLSKQRSMWLRGNRLLKVDKPSIASAWALHDPEYWKTFPVTSPKLFRSDVSAQGALGMYQKTTKKELGGEVSISIYSPGSILCYHLSEIIFLLILSILCLRAKLSRIHA